MKKIAYDTMKFDSVQIVDDTDQRLTVNAVISQEGVYKYPDGRALKCRRELGKMARRLRYAGAKLIVYDHPDSMVIMSQQDVHGGVQRIYMDNGKVRARLTFDKEFCSLEFIDKVRKAASKIGKALDVSIGFYYQPDLKAGVWKGQAYDYIMRDMLLDHVATGVLKGRCPAPACGIGVDTAIRLARRIALDPFADYNDFADCVAKNQDKSNPEAFCAWLHEKVTGKTPAEDHKIKGGMNKKMKKKADYGHAKSPEEIEAEYKECIAQRLADGYTQGEAETLCQASTAPSDEPLPGHTLDQEEQSPYQKCLAEKTEAGMTLEEAEAACKEDGAVKTDQDAAFENCVAREMETGKSREEAEANCRGAHPIVEDAEPEPTPMEVCIANRLEGGEQTEEEARAWCEAELAGEHHEATDMLEHGDKMLRLKEQSVIEQKRRKSS